MNYNLTKYTEVLRKPSPKYYVILTLCKVYIILHIKKIPDGLSQTK